MKQICILNFINIILIIFFVDFEIIKCFTDILKIFLFTFGWFNNLEKL